MVLRMLMSFSLVKLLRTSHGVGLDVTGRVGEEEVGRARQGGGGCFGPGYNEALYVVEDCGSCEGLVRTLLVWLGGIAQRVHSLLWTDL